MDRKDTSRLMEPQPAPVALDLPKPFVITLGNLKGGVGKTTSAFFLACYFATVHNLRVRYIDADPLSQTGYSWYRHLRDNDITVPFKLDPFPSPHLGNYIDDHAADADVFLVDTGGENERIFKAAVEKSHELIIVSATTAGEVGRIKPSFDAAAEAAAHVPHEIGVRVLLVKVPTHYLNKEAATTRRNLAEAEFDAFDAQIPNVDLFRTAVGDTNPLDDLGEYEDVGNELVADYAKVDV